MSAPGLGYIVFEDEGGKLTGKGPIAKFIPAEALAQMAGEGRREGGRCAVLRGRQGRPRSARSPAPARTRIGRELGLIKEGEFKFCWIVDFPMYEWNEDEKKIDFSHNPFSMPQFDRDEVPRARQRRHATTILGIKAYQYDIVCNGIELSSGAIRNHDPEVMLKAFEIAGYAPRGDRGEIRGHAQRVPLRRAAAWRHRARHRPHRHAASRAKRTCAK